MKNIIKAIGRRFRTNYQSGLIQARENSYITIMSQRFHTERRTLKGIIDKVPEKKVMIEIGSLAGFSTRFFSLYFEKVISVDPYIPGYDEAVVNSNQPRLSIAQDIFTLRFFDDPRVEQINKKSVEAATQFEDNSIDFVYIDAGHNYEAVKSDIQTWLPKVKHGSYIAGDDYNARWPGLIKAVREVFPDHEVIEDRWIAKVGH